MATNRFKIKKGLQRINDSTGVSENIIPVGTITMWTSETAPDGWFVCDGTTKSRTIYSELSDFLGAQTPTFPFGNGDGSTTFHVPDLRGRTIIGVGAGPQYTRTLGQSSGTETHTVETANLATHTHNITAHTHNVTVGSIGSMNADSASHAHKYQMTTNNQSGAHSHLHGDHGGHDWTSVTELLSGTNMVRNQAGGGSTTNVGVAGGSGFVTGGYSTGHSHSFSVTVGNPTSHTHTFDTAIPNVSSTDGGFAKDTINHMNPFLVINFIIKY